MIQRIGLAQALINDPELVVLDEPMSGLDPMGRKDVRDIIFELREKGKTVFLSSHILQDVEMICDRVSILVRGELRSEAALNELMDTHRQGVSVSIAGISESQVDALRPLCKTVRVVADTCVFGLDDAETVNRFLTAAMEAGGVIQDVTPTRKSLEELFVEETTRAEMS